MTTRVLLSALLGAAVLAATAGASASPVTRPAPADFVRGVDNPWFPLPRGTTWLYRGVKDGKRARDVVTVTGATKTIEGVRTTAVSDRLYLQGRLEERTTDWYAQDKSGTVWYFGEATAELNRNGQVISREGSWESGRDGAEAGIFMPAHPRVGESFRQEYRKGHAEDHFQVLNLAAPVQTPAVSSHHALLTKEWTPLEPHVLDHKLYVRGFGTVREETVRGPTELNILVSVRRP